MKGVGLFFAVSGLIIGVGGWLYVDSWLGIVGALLQAVGTLLTAVRFRFVLKEE